MLALLGFGHVGVTVLVVGALAWVGKMQMMHKMRYLVDSPLLALLLS